MSFASGIDVQFFVTALMKKVFKALSLRFEMNPAITYEAAMARYGSDKPDLRFDMNVRNPIKPAGTKLANSNNRSVLAMSWSLRNSEACSGHQMAFQLVKRI